jgi:NitT/TauT family transport system substrate-binding protein
VQKKIEMAIHEDFKTVLLRLKPNNFLLMLLLMVFSVLVEAQPRKLTFMPHWLPQAQFAGYYVAQDQGFYEQAGLEVEILHPSASINALTYLNEGKTDIISLFLITALHAADSGINLVNIAQISQNSAIMFVARKSDGISKIADFSNRKVGIWRAGFREAPQALLDKNGVEVEWVPILSTTNLFLLGGIDVMTVMWYNEYNQLYLNGIDHDELNTFFMSDYGFNIPEDGLYVMKNTAETRQDDLTAFIEASLRGWEYARQNTEYTLDMVVTVMRKANIPSNKAHQQWMLEKIFELQSTEEKGVKPTELKQDDFLNALEIYNKFKGSGFLIDYDQFFQPVLPELKKSGNND